MDREVYAAADEGNVGYLPKEADDGSISGSRQKYLGKTHQNNNILHVAARSGRTDFVEAALRQFSILSDQANSQGDTPLHVAARFGHLGVVKVLGSFNNSPSGHRKEEEEGEIEGSVDNGDAPPIWRAKNSEGNTALYEALKNGHEEVSLYLLGLDHEALYSVNGSGESLLYLAAESCCEKVMSAILSSDSSTYSAQGPRRQNALHVVKDCSRTSIHDLLRKRPELVNDLDELGRAAIHYAIEGDYWLWAILMLEFKPSIAYLPDAEGFTPLLRASSRGWWQICRKIVEICPESIESRNREGQNVLHLWFGRSYSDGMKFMKIPRVEELINERDNDGNTALHLAIKNKDHEKAKLLLINTDNVNLKVVNKKGLTALDMCEFEDWKLSYKLK